METDKNKYDDESGTKMFFHKEIDLDYDFGKNPQKKG